MYPVLILCSNSWELETTWNHFRSPIESFWCNTMVNEKFALWTILVGFLLEEPFNSLNSLKCSWEHLNTTIPWTICSISTHDLYDTRKGSHFKCLPIRIKHLKFQLFLLFRISTDFWIQREHSDLSERIDTLQIDYSAELLFNLNLMEMHWTFHVQWLSITKLEVELELLSWFWFFWAL